MTTIKQLSLRYFLAVHNLFSLSVSICTYTISTRVLIKPPYSSRVRFGLGRVSLPQAL